MQAYVLPECTSQQITQLYPPSPSPLLIFLYPTPVQLNIYCELTIIGFWGNSDVSAGLFYKMFQV